MDLNAATDQICDIADHANVEAFKTVTRIIETLPAALRPVALGATFAVIQDKIELSLAQEYQGTPGALPQQVFVETFNDVKAKLAEKRTK
jgi:1,4-dihydroxy-2-naphthoate octaprenyltransferase